MKHEYIHSHAETSKKTHNSETEIVNNNMINIELKIKVN